MKRVLVVGTVGIPACYGGFESLVENLTANRTKNIEYIVCCSGKAYANRLISHNGAKLVYLPFSANGMQSVIYDVFCLAKGLFLRPDVVLVLGVSGCFFLPVFKLFSSAKVITNIDGLEWRRDKWGKFAKWFLKSSESYAVKYSDVIVTDNQAISDYVYEEYGKQSSTIAYGGDHAIVNSETSICNQNYALALCRIEPENNVAMILDAFTKTEQHIKFVGNWNSSQYGKNLKEKYQYYSNIELIDPIYDLQTLYTLRRNCFLYIHGHSAGGTNPSLVEMMHFGIPILAFSCSFNKYSTENGAFYFSCSESLRNTMQNLSKYELKNCGDMMIEIAKRRYTWEEISASYESEYF
ncbi:DUF1972 domain-containing protein [Vibrio mediterranei]|uniref:DUF1972 domain-containing protein n=1 Tax=Vibrio mediterranei TaxID=689 RepID=UPI0038CEA1B1